MIAPSAFTFNEESALTNSFQHLPPDLSRAEIQSRALAEFNAFVDLLEKNGIRVLRFADKLEQQTPDSIFPNNWFSTHPGGEMIIYPMAVKNRRRERRKDIIEELESEFDYRIIDLSAEETAHPPLFLEGTGSMVIDHHNKTIYAAKSPRTNEELLNKVAAILGMKTIVFTAYGSSGELIYHTNVMLCIGVNFTVIGSESIAITDRDRVLENLRATGREIIELSKEQVYHNFAGNMLQLQNPDGKLLVIMSDKAHRSLTPDQIRKLNATNDVILTPAIPTIEQVGGGSVRCMLAEIYKC